MGRRVALLRAVNVGGRKLPMADLRELCVGLGWTDVATYIQSGNLVFSASGNDAAVAAALEKAIADRFGYDAPAIVRTEAEWSAYLKPPFPDIARDAPNRLVLILAKGPPAKGAEDAIQAAARADETVRRAGDAIWVHFPNGQGESKLTPALIDKAFGATATARNFNTVVKLGEMLTS